MQATTLVCAVILTLAAYWAFRLVIPREYHRSGMLRWSASCLELLIWAGYIAFPYLYNPPAWATYWVRPGELAYWPWQLGAILITAGLVLAFGTMFWFGLLRALGRQVEGLIRSGPYAWSRNPQLVLGSLMIVGVIVQRPSVYALIWGLMGLTFGHWMVLAEEAHLGRIFGQEYLQYCAEVPRYLGTRIRRQDENSSSN